MKTQALWCAIEVAGAALAVRKKLSGFGVTIEWEGEQRVLVTGQGAALAEAKAAQSVARSATLVAQQRQERSETDPRKLVIYPLAKQLKGEEWEDSLQDRLNESEGVSGVVSVGFAPDKNPGQKSKGVTAFVVFDTVEQRDEAMKGHRVNSALLDTVFQLGNILPVVEVKDPEWNVALDRRERDPGRAGGFAQASRGQGRSR